MSDENRKSWMGRVADLLFYPFLWPSAARRLKRESDRCAGLDAIIDLAMNFHHGLGRLAVRIPPTQIHSEIKALLELLAERQPRRILEIGTNHGGTLFLFSRVAREDALLVSLDLPEGAFGGGYPKWKVPLFRTFSTGHQELVLLRGDSHVQASLDQVRTILKGERLDFLFIDGDHSYEGVRMDFEQYHGLVRSGGLIAFHDIMPGHPERVGGVAQFWNEIHEKYSHREFISSPTQKGFGIGVLFV